MLWKGKTLHSRRWAGVLTHEGAGRARVTTLVETVRGKRLKMR